MGEKSMPEQDGLYGEWDDSQYDPNDLPDWSLEKEFKEPPPEEDKRFAEFVETLEDKLNDDIGYAQTKETIDIVARMFISDRPNYARAEQIFRHAKLLQLIRATVRARARQLSNVQTVPGGGEALELIRVKSEFPDAPVHADAVVPASWVLDGTEAGPSRYRLTKKVVRRKEGEHYTEHVGVAYNPVVVSATMIDVNDASANLRISWRARRKWRHKVVPRQKLCLSRELIEALSGTHGFPANTNNAKAVIEFLADYEAFNEEVIPTRPMTTQMGWQGRKYEMGFVAGRRHIKGAPDDPEVHYVGADDGEEQLARCFRPAGTMEGWLAAAKITSHFPAVELAIYAALAPSLLSILRAPNFTIDWSHKTSAGKTTTLSVAASVWGNPDPNGSDSLIASWDMTPVGFERRASALSCLPLIVDDTKRAKSYRGESVVPGIVYEITNGQGRIRGSTKGTAKTSYWRTIMLSTGEQRIIDFDKSGGTPARVVTLWGNPFGASSPLVAEGIRKLKGGILENHGHAGPAFVGWLIGQRDKWQEYRAEHGHRWSDIRNRMMELSGGRTMDMSVLDRVACNLAVLDIAASLAHEALDLPWELEQPIDELLPKIIPAAGAVDREREALREVVNWAAQNRGKYCYSEKHRGEEEPAGGWHGFWEAAQDDRWQCLAIFPDTLKRFLGDRGYEPQSIIRQWSEAGWLQAGEPGRFTSRISDLRGRPRLVVITKEAVEGPGDLSGAPCDGQDELPF